MTEKETYETINVRSSTKARFSTQFKEYKETDDAALNRLMDSKGTPKPQTSEQSKKQNASILVLLAAIAFLAIFIQTEIWVKGIVILAMVIAAFLQFKQ